MRDENLRHNWLSYFIASISIIVAFSIILFGCTQTFSDLANPEQLRTIETTLPGQKIWKCVLFGGPPPGGKIVIIILPENAIGPSFGDGCSIQKSQ